MNKIGLIIKREYKTRVVKKSFIIMTIIGPLLIAALIVTPAYLASTQEHKLRTIVVIDQTHVFSDTVINTSLLNNSNIDNREITPEAVFQHRLPDNKYVHFELLPANTTIDSIKSIFKNTNYYALLFIPENLLNSRTIQIYSDKEISLNIKIYLSKFFEKDIEREKLIAKNIDPDILKSIQTTINIESIKWTSKGKEKSTNQEIAMVLGAFAGIFIYMFIFMYSAQVMRGVIEEKTSRIIEIIISSVKPLQLMMGKIIGIALVGLTQFILWILLTFGIVTAIQSFSSFSLNHQNNEQVQSLMTKINSSQIQPTLEKENTEMNEFVKVVYYTLSSIDWTTMIFSFFFFFLAGYLLYASMFAAVGSAVDNETDTQQFVLPLTVPLILSLVMLQTFLNFPDSSLSFWFSIIPFTSPVVMMIRIPFGVPWWQLAISITVLLLSIFLIMWISSKIYRIGILMYGKKVSYRDLFKWLQYKK